MPLAGSWWAAACSGILFFMGIELSMGGGGFDALYLCIAGADYVTVTRLSDAHELFTVIEAADASLLEDKRAEMDAQLSEKEVLP